MRKEMLKDGIVLLASSMEHHDRRRDYFMHRTSDCTIIENLSDRGSLEDTYVSERIRWILSVQNDEM